MKRGRRAILVCGATASAIVALIAACTFPDPTFAPEAPSGNDGSSAEGSTSDGAADALADVSDDVHVLVDGGDPDALIVKDAGAKVDASGCMTCDCDDDGYLDTTKTGCNTPDAGAHDCDDEDSRTHPTQGFLVDPAEPPQNGNWNCTGGVEKFYSAKVACTSLAPGAVCDSTFGFEDDPKCGATGTFVTCKSVGGVLGLLRTCAVGARALGTKQACK